MHISLALSVEYILILMTTTHSNPVNSELPGGRFRPVNFLRSPFYLPAPLCLGKDTVSEPDLFVMLSDLQSLSLDL